MQNAYYSNPVEPKNSKAKTTSVFNLQKLISQNKPGKFPMGDIQIFVILDNITGRVVAIPDSPKNAWVMWDNILQDLDLLDSYIYPKVICGPDDWKERYWWMRQAFKNAHLLIHSDALSLKKMIFSRLTFYNMVLASLGYTDPYAETITEKTDLTETDDEESVTVYDND